MDKSAQFHLHMGCGESLGGSLGHQAEGKRAQSQKPGLRLRNQNKPEADRRFKHGR